MALLNRGIVLMMGICCAFSLNVTILTDSNGFNHGKFGHNIASNGEVVAVSNHPTKGGDAKVILFRDYEESVVIHNMNDKSMESIEMSNNCIVISTPMDKFGGSAYIYDKSGLFITQINGKEVAPLMQSNAEFGSSIKFLTDNLLLIGAKNNGPSGSGDVFVFNQIETNVWMTSGSFNGGPEETSFGNHIAYDNVTHTVMISSLTNVYLYSLDQIKDISNHHNIGPIFVGPLDVIEFDYEVANIVMGHNYAMISLSGKENGHIKCNYVSIYSLGIDHTVAHIQSINADDWYTEKGNLLHITTQSNGDVVFMVGAKSATTSCVLVYNENTVFDDDGDSKFASICADTNGFGSSIAVVNNDVYVGYELYNGPGIAIGAVVVFSEYLNVKADDDEGETYTEDERDYTIHIEDSPAHHSSSSSIKASTKAITISMASLAFIAVMYCIYLAKFNSGNKHKLIDGESDGQPIDKWNEKMHEQQALNISKEIV